MESKEDPISYEISTINCKLYSPAEIKAVSVKQIVESVAFDDLGRVVPNGLYDYSMGPSPYDRAQDCETCGLTKFTCPGHFGHIELPVPVYNPFMMKILHNVLRSKCFNCHRFKAPTKDKFYYYLKFLCIKAGLSKEASELQRIINGSKTSSKVMERLYKVATFYKVGEKILNEEDDGDEAIENRKTIDITEEIEERRANEKDFVFNDDVMESKVKNLKRIVKRLKKVNEAPIIEMDCQILLKLFIN